MTVLKVVLFFCLVVLCTLAGPAAQADCEVENVCVQPSPRDYADGERFGLVIEVEWLEVNHERLATLFTPACESFSQCIAVGGNPIGFCRERFARELRKDCVGAWASRGDESNCHIAAEIYSSAQFGPAGVVWSDYQECAVAALMGGKSPSPRVELDPPSLAPGESVQLVVKAFHPVSGQPVYAQVSIDGQAVGPTFTPFGYAMKYRRSRDELGRISLQPPEITVHFTKIAGSEYPAFDNVATRFDSPIPSLELLLDPEPGRWTSGDNLVRITAVDAVSRDEVSARILAPGTHLGSSGDAVRIVLRKSGEALCGEPVWVHVANYPDASLPIEPCPHD